MHNIAMPYDQGFGFGTPINDLFRFLKAIQQAGIDPLNIDFSESRFLNPIFLLGVRLITQHFQSTGMSLRFDTKCKSRYFQDYLLLTHFERGFQPAALSTMECDQVLQQYRSKTYLPLTIFPVGMAKEATSVREHLQGAIASHIRHRLGLSGQVYEAISYLIAEMVNNINDHSRQPNGYLVTQFYPSKGYIDICFADIGVGFLGSYQIAGYSEIDTHESAIRAARMGKSTKDDPQRGFGFRTSRNLLVNGLGGKYFLFSGDAFLYSDRNAPESVRTLNIKPLISWPGAFVAMRVPTVASPAFSIYEYVE